MNLALTKGVYLDIVFTVIIGALRTMVHFKFIESFSLHQIFIYFYHKILLYVSLFSFSSLIQALSEDNNEAILLLI